MDWNAPQHSYEELRQVVVEALFGGSDQFEKLLEDVGRILNARLSAPNLPTGYAYPGAASQMHPYDRELVREIVWDLFRQGIITLGINSSNPGWPWLKLSRFGKRAMDGGYHNRFHDTDSYTKMLRSQAPDISAEAVIYLEEAVASFYSGCMLACVVMLGVAAEAEFLRLIDIAIVKHATAFEPASRAPAIRQKIIKFQSGLQPILPTLQPKKDFEDVETNLSMIQAVLRVARNDAGHPSGNPPPERDQVYIYLQLFMPFAKQLMKLRIALG